MGAERRKHTLTESNGTEISAFGSCKSARPPADVVKHSEGSHLSQETRYRVDALRVALVADTAVAKERARSRNPDLKSRADANQVEGAAATISARVA